MRRGPRLGVWLPLGLMALAGTLLLDLSGLLDRPNHMLQDAWVRLHTQDVSASEVVIVAIDDTSVAALGQWPWPRSLHAQLIDRISRALPRAIGLVVLLLDASGDDQADAQLAASLRRSGKVALPMIMQRVDGMALAALPLPAFACAAAALGHAHLDVDNDGVARAIHLYEGQGARLWPHLALAMWQIAQSAPPEPSAGTFAEPARPCTGPAPGGTRQPASEWRHLERSIIAFAGPARHFPSVSYVDVLEGRVPPEVFRNRHVIVGATAAGTGDAYATPVSGQPRLMSGVEITANVLQGLLTQRAIQPLPPLANGLLNAAAVLVVMLGLATLGPLAALLATALAVAALPALSAAALNGAHLQFAPAAGLAGIILTYALWSWQRLNAASRYLVEEFEALRGNTGIGRWAGAPAAPAACGDFLSRRIQALEQAAQHMRDLYQLLSDSLESLPDATLACDLDGHVLLANPPAARLLRQTAQELAGQPVVLLLRGVRQANDYQPALPPARLAPGQGALAIEARDAQGRDLLLKLAPSRNAAAQRTGWLVSLVDISEMRRAQRQRAEAIRFLGHDIRAPQSSILALLDLRRRDPLHISAEQFEARVERHARKTLKLSDDFIQLLRAQSHDYRFEPHDLAAILDECLDDAWEAASQRHITLTLEAGSAHEAWINADRELVSRALANLVGNAVKFSPDGGTIGCAIGSAALEGEAAWHVTVADQGPGIAAQEQARLFAPFARGKQASQADGAGLGLALVKAVAERHGGQATLESSAGHGARFGLLLPMPRPARQAPVSPGRTTAHGRPGRPAPRPPEAQARTPTAAPAPSRPGRWPHPCCAPD